MTETRDVIILATPAATGPDAFTRVAARLGPDFAANVERAPAEYLAGPPGVLPSRRRSERSAVAALTAPSGVRAGEFGPATLRSASPARPWISDC